MKLTKFLAAVSTLCFLGGVAGATESSFVGKYTFNWLKSPGKQHCIKVDEKLASRLSSKEFRCKQNEGKTEAGDTVPACRRVAGGVEYLIFDSRISCENERKAQDANSEE
jgi:hypothetical protein